MISNCIALCTVLSVWKSKSRDYGDARRRLQVSKLRGSSFKEGFHDYVIRTGGVVVFPRLIAAEYRGESEISPVPSGIKELDALTGGGLDRGTSTLIMGPAGCGKTTIAIRWVISAAEKGENCGILHIRRRETYSYYSCRRLRDGPASARRIWASYARSN